ncbi:hypothetical protein [Mycetocola manganoxydans]|uniref:hypothetical protein n=1 Tax=Mycetocola manganoxydans TaxID=699879 RepID=UPI0019AC7551|nr:hypothetical protein [Mycetocola manganoxydans]GHD49416.1 hypothetical protein GCM10008097_22240 [Mycetocola manganoxydans]
MSDETLNPPGTVPSGDPVTKPRTDGDLTDQEQTGKDMSYSPSSGQETEERQQSSDSEAFNDSDIDQDNVNLLPGTGGPDDVGDIDVDPGEIDLEGNAGIS